MPEADNNVTLERILTTEIFADKDDSWYGEPRQLFQFKLCDRNVLVGQFPKAQLEIAKAQRAYVDGSGESSETISDQIICMEAWHRRSFDGAKDGRHVIVCSEGVILDEAWEKDQFPFVKMSYNPHPVGYFSQGAAEQIMGTQLAINKLLSTIEEAMHKIAVPRIFLDELSKVTESSINNNVGTIIKFRGQPPQFSVSPVMPPESYQHLERLIGYAYQQLGISQLAASSQKPAGLNSGEAQRVFLENQDTRFEALETRYNDFYVALAYQMIDMAKDIAKETGEYLTVYPDKDGTREVDLPKAEILKDYYVIQCLEESSLPREPGGRYAQLSEMLASNEITLSEFRALQQMPDLKKADEMANALRDRITDILDSIVEKNTDPVADEFLLDPANTATQMTVQYINRYTIADLEESKLQKMRDFLTQIETLKSQATAPPPQPMPEPGQAQGNPNQAPPPAAPPTPNSLVSAV